MWDRLEKSISPTGREGSNEAPNGPSLVLLLLGFSCGPPAPRDLKARLFVSWRGSTVLHVELGPHSHRVIYSACLIVVKVPQSEGHWGGNLAPLAEF